MTWNVWWFKELTRHKYLTNIYLCWEFALPTSTILNIYGHFKQFQLNYLPSHLSKLAKIFLETSSHPVPPSNFIHVPFQPYGDLDRYPYSKTFPLLQKNSVWANLPTILHLWPHRLFIPPFLHAPILQPCFKFCSEQVKSSYIDRYAKPMPKQDLLQYTFTNTV